jgi:hypothetical protein
MGLPPQIPVFSVLSPQQNLLITPLAVMQLVKVVPAAVITELDVVWIQFLDTQSQPMIFQPFTNPASILSRPTTRTK